MEDLMIPRYKVIADFPFNNYYKVGGIITDHKNISARNENGHAVFACSFSEFPNIFLPISWWEDRKPEDMPMYLKYQNNGKIRKVKAFHGSGDYMTVEFEGGRTRRMKKEWTPCTEEQFLEQEITEELTPIK